MSPECRRAYDRYVQAQWGDVTDVERLAETMFRAGGREAIASMVQFSDLMPRFDALELQIKRIRNVLEAFQSEVPMPQRRASDGYTGQFQGDTGIRTGRI